MSNFGMPPKAPETDTTADFPGTERSRVVADTVYGRGESMTGPDVWLHGDGKGWTKFGTVDRIVKLTHPEHGTFLKISGLPLALFAQGWGASSEEAWIKVLDGDDFAGTGRVASQLDFTDSARKGDVVTYGGGTDELVPSYLETAERPKGIRNIIE